MALQVAPQAVTLYDVVKDLGLPAAFAIILLFQIGPKLDQVATTNAQIETQISVVAQLCGGKSA